MTAGISVDLNSDLGEGFGLLARFQSSLQQIG